jgi:2,4-dienoyl-CoA reductase-like NADH-dependent reductase (Old Yellow Enzyme family)
MKPRQIIFNFAFDGALVNTSIVEWIDEKRQGDARNATPEDISAISDEIAQGYLTQIEALKAAHAEQIATIQGVPVKNSGEVTPRQIRLAMLQTGLDLVAITAMLSQDPAAFIEWEYAEVIRRDHPLVIQMGEALNIPAEQIDDLFALAATL